MKANFLSRIAMLTGFVALLLTAQGCPWEDPGSQEEQKKIDADPDYAAKSFLRAQYMDVFYYWRDDVMARNAGYKPYDYDIYDFFDKMLYSRDRWSWMCDKEDYISSETGVIQGTWGVSLGQATEYYRDYGIRVRYIYPGSPFEEFGVTRGAVMTKIAGKSIEYDETGFTREKLNWFNENYVKTPQSFTFRLVDGREVSFTASMATSLSTRPSLITRIFEPGEFPGLTERVGYFLYMGFKANFLDDINQAMKTFHDAGVRKLIVDLRYNGGGDSRASQLMVDYLAPKEAEGKPYVIRKHNSYLASLSDAYSDSNNTATVIPSQKEDYQQYYEDREELLAMYQYWQQVYPNRLDLDGLYFITGEGSASASEMVINGLRPYMGERLQMVGDTTYGKPNGMYVLMYPGTNDDYKAYSKGDFSNLQWVFLPICFYNENSMGQQIPDDGFIPNLYRPDDLFHDFGVEESSISACLTHLTQGRYPTDIPGTKAGIGVTKSGGYGNYRIETEESSPRYGVYTVQRPLP